MFPTIRRLPPAPKKTPVVKVPIHLAQGVARLLNIPKHVNPVFNSNIYNNLSPTDQAVVNQAAPHVIAAMGGDSAFSNAPVTPGALPGPSSAVAGYGAGAPSSGPQFTPAGPANPDYEGYEAYADLNPATSLKRKPWPVHILPASVLTDANGNGTMTWTPQEDFQAFLLTFPSQITSTGYLTQIQVGTRLVNVASGKMPIECFSEKNDARRMDFPFAKATQQIAAQIAGGPASTTVYGVLLGYGVGAPMKYPVAAARMGILPLGTTSIASAATTTITVTPQERFKPRRVILNSTATQFGSLLITGFQIGTLVQQAQTGSYPAGVFSDLAIDDWVDFDVCPKNSNIAITVNNTSASTNNGVFEGFILGDVWYDGELDQAA